MHGFRWVEKDTVTPTWLSISSYLATLGRKSLVMGNSWRLECPRLPRFGGDLIIVARRSGLPHWRLVVFCCQDEGAPISSLAARFRSCPLANEMKLNFISLRPSSERALISLPSPVLIADESQAKSNLNCGALG